jgi:hypothetical protein
VARTDLAIKVSEAIYGSGRYTRTDGRLARVFVNVESTFAISDKERQIKEVLDRLRKALFQVRIHNEFEKIDRPRIFKKSFQLVVGVKIRFRRLR